MPNQDGMRLGLGIRKEKDVMERFKDRQLNAIEEYKDCLMCKYNHSCLSVLSECPKKYNLHHYQLEALCAITGFIPLDRLEEICNAEAGGRLAEVVRC